MTIKQAWSIYNTGNNDVRTEERYKNAVRTLLKTGAMKIADDGISFEPVKGISLMTNLGFISPTDEAVLVELGMGG